MPRELLKTYLRYVLAFVLTSLSMMLGNILDGVMVGQIVGPDAVAAVGTTLPMLQGYYSLYVLIGGGGGMLVGLAIGKKRRDEASHIFSSAAGTIFCFSLLLCLVGAIAAGPIASQFCTSEAIQPLASSYMRWMLLGAPAYFAFFFFQTFVSVDGEPGLVTVAVAADSIINVIVSICLMSFTGLGVAGAAIGTVIGHASASFLLIALHWHRKKSAEHLVFFVSHLFDISAAGRMAAQGAPLAISSFCTTLQYFFCNRIVMSGLGKEGMFIYAVSLNVLPLFQLFISGTSQTLQTLGSVEKGKGGPGFVQMVRFSYGFLGSALTLVCVVLWCCPGFVVRLFGGEDCPELIPVAADALRLFAPSFVLLGLLFIRMIVQKLSGYNREAMFISMTLMLMPVPVMWVLAHVAPEWIWWSYLGGNMLEVTLIFIFNLFIKERR